MEEIKIGTSETHPLTISTPNDIESIENINSGKKFYVKLKLESHFEDILEKARNTMVAGEFKIYLDIEGVYLTHKMILILADFLEETEIEVYGFDASFSSISDGDFSHIVEERGFLVLKYLTINFIRVTSSGFDALERLYKNNSIPVQLEEINVKGLSIGEFDSFKWILSNCRHLRSLNLSLTDCTPQLIEEILNYPECLNIVNLSIGFLQYYSDDGSESEENELIEEIIVELSNLKQLESLDLNGSMLDVVHYKYIVKLLASKHEVFLVSLKTLILDCCNLKDNFIDYICSNSNLLEYIEHLSMKSNEFSEKGLNILISRCSSLNNVNNIIIDIRLNNFNKNTCAILEERFECLRLLPTESMQQRIDDYAYYNTFLELPLQNNSVIINEALETPEEEVYIMCDESENDLSSSNHCLHCKNVEQDKSAVLNKLSIFTTQKESSSILNNTLLTGNTISYDPETEVELNFISDDLADKRNQIINPDNILSYQENVQAINDYLFKESDLSVHKISLNSNVDGWKMIDDPEKSIFTEEKRENSNILLGHEDSNESNDNNIQVTDINKTAGGVYHSQELSNSNEYVLESQGTGLHGEKPLQEQRENINKHYFGNTNENSENSNLNESENLKETHIIELSELSYDYEVHGSHNQENELQYETDAYNNDGLYEINHETTHSSENLYINNESLRLNPELEQPVELSSLENILLQNIEHAYKTNQSAFKRKVDTYFMGTANGEYPLMYVPDNTIFLDLANIEEQRKDQIRKAFKDIAPLSVSIENLHIYKELNLYFEIEVRQDVDDEEEFAQNEETLVEGTWDIVFTPEIIFLVNTIKHKAIGIELTADFLLAGRFNGYMIVYVNDWETDCKYHIGVQEKDFKEFTEVLSILVYTNYSEHYNNDEHTKYINTLNMIK